MEFEHVKEQLLQQDAHFRSLHEKHHLYDEQLQEIEALRFPTQQEQLREAELKKLKLHLKDEMDMAMRSFLEDPR